MQEKILKQIREISIHNFDLFNCISQFPSPSTSSHTAVFKYRNCQRIRSISLLLSCSENRTWIHPTTLSLLQHTHQQFCRQSFHKTYNRQWIIFKSLTTRLQIYNNALTNYFLNVQIMWERYFSYFREFLIFSYPSLLWYIKISSHIMYSQRNIIICCITITSVFHTL